MNIGTKVTHKFNGEMVGEVVAIGTGPFAGKAKVQIDKIPMPSKQIVYDLEKYTSARKAA